MTIDANIDHVMRALSDPTRRAVFEKIAASDEISVKDLTLGSGVSQGAVSQHLRTLKAAGLVADRAQGRHVYYRIEKGGLAPLVDWMDHYAAFWRDRFADLRELLKDIGE